MFTLDWRDEGRWNGGGTIQLTWYLDEVQNKKITIKNNPNYISLYHLYLHLYLYIYPWKEIKENFIFRT